MEWNEARQQTLQLWAGVRDSLGSKHPVDLLTDVNVMTALCELSQQEADGEWGRCTYCPFYREFGGCHAASGAISDLIAARDWDAARELADEMIAHLELLQIPPAQA